MGICMMLMHSLLQDHKGKGPLDRQRSSPTWISSCLPDVAGPHCMRHGLDRLPITPSQDLMTCSLVLSISSSSKCFSRISIEPSYQSGSRSCSRQSGHSFTSTADLSQLHHHLQITHDGTSLADEQPTWQHHSEPSGS